MVYGVCNHDVHLKFRFSLTMPPLSGQGKSAKNLEKYREQLPLTCVMPLWSFGRGRQENAEHNIGRIFWEGRGVLRKRSHSRSYSIQVQVHDYSSLFIYFLWEHTLSAGFRRVRKKIKEKGRKVSGAHNYFDLEGGINCELSLLLLL